MVTYKIVRHYFAHDTEEIETGLTLEEAQAHCKDPESSSRTCTSMEGEERTRTMGTWFDGYTEE